MPLSRSPLRLVRGAVAATIATAVALAGHVLGGGDVPTWIGVALPWWLSVTVCAVLAGARFSLPRLGLAVLSSQLLFHGLFLAGTPGDPTVQLVDPPGSHLGHGAGGLHGTGGMHEAVGTGSAHLATSAQHALHAAHLDAQMVLWHVLAAVATTLLLHRGEATLFRCLGAAVQLLGALGRVVLLVLAPLVVLSVPRPITADAEPRSAVQQAVLSPLRRRGPPPALTA